MTDKKINHPESIDKDTLIQNYQSIEASIRQSETHHQRAANSVKLVAVSKTKPAQAIRTLYDVGQKAFGENYLQEAIEKITVLEDCDIEWHFIGHIQSNKTAIIAENFDWVHGVDRLKIATRLSQQRPAHLPPLNIFLQVNIENEDSKSGFSAEELMNTLTQLNELPNIVIQGLMAIPKPHPETHQQRAVFQQVHALNEQCKNIIPSMQHLSMGMTNDMDAAIAEGSSFIRIGTAIFGERNYS